MKRVRLQRWGNSLGLRIPKPFAEQLGLSAGGEVELVLSNEGLLITPRPRYELSKLVDAIAENQHPELDWGEAQGRESW